MIDESGKELWSDAELEILEEQGIEPESKEAKDYMDDLIEMGDEDEIDRRSHGY